MSDHVIVLGTKNPGKLKEIRDLLVDQPVAVVGLDEMRDVPEPEETEDSFEDNAYLKASYYAQMFGFPALADDSGLVVEALGGAPGVRSSRWAGEQANDQDRVAKLLQEMKGLQNRKAAFACALVLAVPSGPGLTWVGRCEGEITENPRGQNGFGYDPVFFYPQLNRTFAELTTEEKNQVSHRGKALAEFKSEFDKVLFWLERRLGETHHSL